MIGNYTLYAATKTENGIFTIIIGAEATVFNCWELRKNHQLSWRIVKHRRQLRLHSEQREMIFWNKISTIIWLSKKFLPVSAMSLAYAEPNTKELAFSFDHRSVVLHHIKTYDLYLVDTDAVLNLTTSKS